MLLKFTSTLLAFPCAGKHARPLAARSSIYFSAFAVISFLFSFPFSFVGWLMCCFCTFHLSVWGMSAALTLCFCYFCILFSFAKNNMTHAHTSSVIRNWYTIYNHISISVDLCTYVLAGVVAVVRLIVCLLSVGFAGWNVAFSLVFLTYFIEYLFFSCSNVI